MKSTERIKQDMQTLISAANTYIVEEDFEFEGQNVKAYLILPPNLKSRSDEVAKAVFTEDVLENEMEVLTEESEVPEPVVITPKKKVVVKKASKKAKK